MSLGFACVAVILAGLALTLEMRSSRSERMLSFIADVIHEYRNEDFKDRLEFILTEMPSRVQSDEQGRPVVAKDDFRRCRPVVGFFNNVGILVAEGNLKIELVSAVMGTSVLRTWNILGPAIYADREIREERKVREDGVIRTDGLTAQERSVYFAHFEDLVGRLREIPASELRKRLKLRLAPPPEWAPPVGDTVGNKNSA